MIEHIMKILWFILLPIAIALGVRMAMKGNRIGIVQAVLATLLLILKCLVK